MRRVLEDLHHRPYNAADEAVSSAPLRPPMLRVCSSSSRVGSCWPGVRACCSWLWTAASFLAWDLWPGGSQEAFCCCRHLPLCSHGWKCASCPLSLQNNWPSQNNSCLVGKLFKQQVVAAKGFEWVNEGTQDKPKWGYVGKHPNATLRFTVNTATATAAASTEGVRRLRAVCAPERSCQLVFAVQPALCARHHVLLPVLLLLLLLLMALGAPWLAVLLSGGGVRSCRRACSSSPATFPSSFFAGCCNRRHADPHSRGCAVLAQLSRHGHV